VIDKLQTYHPDLLLVNFREPDWSGHQANWTNYLAGIRSTDRYCKQIWEFLQDDPYYAGTTTFIVTNDHGRHSTGHLDGFVSHGDQCWGCRHVELVAVGPDFRSNAILPYAYEQVDIPNTIGELLGFAVPTSKGKVMQKLFK
jgi:bisphosphoglycerate-independent phosphoglycerate mutase (AlkP superfamily)